jgi:hypothetical protein
MKIKKRLRKRRRVIRAVETEPLQMSELMPSIRKSQIQQRKSDAGDGGKPMTSQSVPNLGLEESGVPIEGEDGEQYDQDFEGEEREEFASEDVSQYGLERYWIFVLRY